MAERRMFAQTIIDSDAFLEMPLSTQALYFHLSMRADDEGFINNPKKIQRMIGSSDDDLKILIAKNFVIPFESGIVVIKHWKIHNYIRKDRLVETKYREERQQLTVKENGAYTLGNQMSVSCQSNVSIDKDSIGKYSIVEEREIYKEKESAEALENTQEKEKVAQKEKELLKNKEKENILKEREIKKFFVKPSVEEVKQYCEERKNNIDYVKFYDFYESKGWMVGKNKMKDWKACVRTWERSREIGSISPRNKSEKDTPDWYSQYEDKWKKSADNTTEELTDAARKLFSNNK